MVHISFKSFVKHKHTHAQNPSTKAKGKEKIQWPFSPLTLWITSLEDRHENIQLQHIANLAEDHDPNALVIISLFRMKMPARKNKQHNWL